MALSNTWDDAWSIFKQEKNGCLGVKFAVIASCLIYDCLVSQFDLRFVSYNQLEQQKVCNVIISNPSQTVDI